MDRKFKKILFLILIACIPFLLSTKRVFYGFEYEDAFINTYVAVQNEPLNYSEKYRTQGCDQLIYGQCVKKSNYTGHYLTYSLYLSFWNKLLKPLRFNLHKISNFWLYLTSIIVSFLIVKDEEKAWLKLSVFFTIVSFSLPAIYVFNSSLIENLSFAIGIIFMSILYRCFLTSKTSLKIIGLLLLTLLLVIKRENLVLLLLLPLFLDIQDLKSKWFWLSFIPLILTQSFLNPFYTEALEAAYLCKPTFSVDYLIFQLPTYLTTFFSINGFIGLTVIGTLFLKLNKQSVFFLVVFITFLLIYATHYRSQFAVLSEEISLFETYRYTTNLIPLLFGVVLFSNNRHYNHLRSLISIVLLCILLYNSNIKILGFFEDEERNYHILNEKIEDSIEGDERILIIDNFNIISMLNKNINNLDIVRFEKNWENSIKITDYHKIYLIDRYLSIEEFYMIDSNRFLLTKNEEFSLGSSAVYDVILR